MINNNFIILIHQFILSKFLSLPNSVISGEAF